MLNRLFTVDVTINSDKISEYKMCGYLEEPFYSKLWSNTLFVEQISQDNRPCVSQPNDELRSV